jgi:membrane protein
LEQRTVTPDQGRTPRIDRDRILRTLTFWFRPAFVLRAVNRFQKIAAFDRAVALASSALTAAVALLVLVGAILPGHSGADLADRIINRYDLTGGGADAVRDMFAVPDGTTSSIGVLGAVFLLVAALSFTRAVQRLFEQAWELKPLSVRNTLNDLQWLGGFAAYVAVTGWIHALLGVGRLELVATLVALPVGFAFLWWTGRVLSAGRIAWRDLLPFAVIAAVLTAIYSVAATVYVPHLFSTYATRYGVIGAVFAMISILFCAMLAIVASAAVGREVGDELGHIRRGDRPADDEVRREWDNVIAEARAKWDVAREELARRRARRDEARPPET